MNTLNTYEQPLVRPLKVYAFDPSQGRTLGNHMTIDVGYENLKPGPVGKYLEVIDYDAGNGCYYEAVDLDQPFVLIRGGLEPSESDPRFHQQMVYAVASETIRRFEFALGRKIKWGFNRNSPVKYPLRIFPHGMQEANAFYSRDLRALVFGYFPASEAEAGINLPGQTVFTCLSHDIIAHETTHALIDGQRMYFMEPTSPDTLAFHEAFADIVALFQHFGFKEALLDVIKRTGGLIHRMNVAPEIAAENNQPVIASELSTTNPLVQLARQFGEAMGKRAALRSALGTPPNSKELEKLFEPHDRGAILVAAVFDAFFTIYIRRTRDLLRIAKAGSATQSNSGELHPDLAERLAGEASKTADHFLNICIRALDYCPPVDINFGDFLRAIVTADYDLVQDDAVGYRAAIIDAFRSRGIYPNDINSLAEESLRWCPPEEISGKSMPRCQGLIFDLFRPGTPAQAKQNAVILSNFGKNNSQALGFEPDVPVKAHTFHPVHRVAPNGQLKIEAIVELTQQREVLLDPADKKSKFTFRGGTTLVIDLAPEREGEIRYAIRKNLGQNTARNQRLERQRNYFLSSSGLSALNVYSKDDSHDPAKSGLDFSLVHRGF